jgi:hypothetical protein
MPSPEFMVAPMRQDLVKVGFTELRTPADVTDRAHQYMMGYPPSSPPVALFKDGELVYFMERRRIEGRHPGDIAADLRAAYARFC